MGLRHNREVALILLPYLAGMFALVLLPAVVTFGLALTD